MKENENKELDKLISRVIKETPLQKPSFDFTARVMAQTAEVAKSAVPVYKPLLPWPFWMVLAIAIAGLLGYAYFAGSTQEIPANGSSFKALYDGAFESIVANLKFSKTAMYATIALLLATLVHITIIKNRFVRNMER